jgi:hypothetical protein
MKSLSRAVKRQGVTQLLRVSHDFESYRVVAGETL